MESPFLLPFDITDHDFHFGSSTSGSQGLSDSDEERELRKLTKAERRKRRRATPKYRNLHATRERVRVESFNNAFAALRSLLPTLPVEKKLSKIEILRISIAYIKYLDHILTVY
ncbi:hlh-15 [Pristionchus pacificus]|nr:hlh-15 [Pristionchus pacificus]